MDTGTGFSVIDIGTLRRLNLENTVDKSRARPLINASGDKMQITGSVNIEVKLPGINMYNHTLQVLNSLTYSNILIGRDFMSKFGSIKFDFVNNKIQLGQVWLNGLSVANNIVRLCENTKIPARSEHTVLVKYTT